MRGKSRYGTPRNMAAATGPPAARDRADRRGDRLRSHRLSSSASQTPLTGCEGRLGEMNALSCKKWAEKCVKSVHFLAPFRLVFVSFRSSGFRFRWFRALPCDGPARWRRLRVALDAGHGSGGMGRNAHPAWDARPVGSCRRGRPRRHPTPSPHTRGPGHSDNRRGAISGDREVGLRFMAADRQVSETTKDGTRKTGHRAATDRAPERQYYSILLGVVKGGLKLPGGGCGWFPMAF